MQDEFENVQSRRRFPRKPLRRHLRGDVLVIERNRVTRGKLRIILENLGFRAVTARNAREGIALVNELGLEIVCLVCSSDVAGSDTLKSYFREISPLMPTILLEDRKSGALKRTQRTKRRLHTRYSLRKPVSVSEFKSLILSLAEPEVLPLAAN